MVWIRITGGQRSPFVSTPWHDERYLQIVSKFAKCGLRWKRLWLVDYGKFRLGPTLIVEESRIIDPSLIHH